MQLPVEPIVTELGYGAQSRTTCSLTATTAACESMTTITDDQSVPYDDHRDEDDEGAAIIIDNERVKESKSKNTISPYADEEYNKLLEYPHDARGPQSGSKTKLPDLHKQYHCSQGMV